MRVAVIDVGSNSVRLLVASVERHRDVRELRRERVYLRLGDDAYRLGRIGQRKLDELAETAELYARRARASRVGRLQTIVTAPGRQAANAEELVDVLADATSGPVAVLSAEDEGRLAWEGAVVATTLRAGTIGVVDLGGGSCEVAVGTSATGPRRVWSRDAGALRVTRSLLPSTRLSARDVAAARKAIRKLLEGVDPARPDTAFAVGGTARALGRVIGPRFGPRKLDALAEAIVRHGAATTVGGHGITEGRVETLLGGTLVLSELSRGLDAKFEVARGGLREGAVLRLARAESAAAA